MKNLTTLIFLFLGIGIIQAQDMEIKKKGNYYFDYLQIDSIENNSSLFTTNKAEVLKLLVGTSYIVNVKQIKKNRVYFVFGKFTKADLNNKINKLIFSTTKRDTSIPKSNNSPRNENNIDQSPDTRTIYSLPLEVFRESTSPYYNRIEYRVGVYTVPFKLRFSSFSFDANVNLGTNLGAKIRINRRVENGFALEPIFGFGLSSIKLDETNSTKTEPTNISAFTLNTGVLIHITNNINVGLTYGIDNISQSDQNNYNWKYQNKGWLGLGINIAFNNQSNNTGSPGN